MCQALVNMHVVRERLTCMRHVNANAYACAITCTCALCMRPCAHAHTRTQATCSRHVHVHGSMPVHVHVRLIHINAESLEQPKRTCRTATGPKPRGQQKGTPSPARAGALPAHVLLGNKTKGDDSFRVPRRGDAMSPTTRAWSYARCSADKVPGLRIRRDAPIQERRLCPAAACHCLSS